VNVTPARSGEAGIADAVRQQAPGPGGVGRALEDDGIAGHEGRGQGSTAKGEREVEGHDHSPHAVRLEDGAVVRTPVGQRIVGQGEVVALVALELGRVAGEEVRRLLRLAERLHAVLADLEGERRSDVVDPFLDQLRGSPDEPQTLLVRGHAPGRKCLLRRRHGALDVVGVPDRKVAKDHALIDGAAVFGGLLDLDVLTVEEHRMGGSEAGPDFSQGLFEAGVHLLRGIEHGRVGEFEGHDHSNSMSRRSITASASIRSSSSIKRRPLPASPDRRRP
jgi:hypothetical protein